MFSLFRILLVSAVVCLASTGWSLPQLTKTCSPDKMFSAEFKLVDKTLAVSWSFTNPEGATKGASGVVNITNETPFTVSMISPENAANMARAAGIPSFTGGFRTEVETNNSQSVFWFFEYEPGQYSVVWVVDEDIIPMGQTTSCK